MPSMFRSATSLSSIGFLPVVFVAVGLALLLSSSEPSSAGGTTFTVTNADDPGNGVCDSQCTLREAIAIANGGQGNTIAFNLPGCPANGANCVIQPGSALPAITELGTTIDGGTQPGYDGKPLVVLDGSLAGASSGILMGGSNQTLIGLEIRNFAMAGVIPGAPAQSGPWVVLRNYIHDNGTTGVDGFSPCAGNFTVVANTITGHDTIGGVGVSSCGDSIEIHYNRIYGNTIGVEDTGMSFFANAQNNWWGCNEGPGLGGCDEASGPVASSPWLTLTFGANPTSIPGGGTSALTAKVVVNSDGLNTTGLGSILDGTPITFGTDLGSVGSDFVVKQTITSVAAATLTADEGPGTASVTAALDAESVGATVDITTAPPTPTPTASPSPTPTPTPTPTETATATPPGTETPTASPTPSPTPTHTPTPTPSQHRQGDVNCDTNVTSVDSLGILRFVAGLPPLSQNEPCPDIGTGNSEFFGDVDCKNLVNSVDALGILRFVAGLPALGQQEPCTDIGNSPATGT